MKRRRILVVTLGLAIAPLAAGAAPAPVTARVVTDAAHLGPGAVVRVGVLLSIQAGWHVYWRNPGDAGLATAVTLDAPENLVAGELEWPLPQRMVDPGGLVAYGYTGEVLLVRPVTVREAPSGGRAMVTVRASWLACRDVCVVGEAALPVALPVAKPTAIRGAALVTAWRGRLPSPPREGPHVTVRGGLDGDPKGIVTVWLQWSRAPVSTMWFPAPEPAIAVSDVRVRNRRESTRIDLVVRPRAGLGPVLDHLDSVVVAVDADGARRGFDLPVPLRNGTPASGGAAAPAANEEESHHAPS